MALLRGLLWRVLLALVHAYRGLAAWLRSGPWPGVGPGPLLPLTLLGLSEPPQSRGGASSGPRRPWRRPPGGASVEKLPAHVGLLVTEEELSYTDIASLVVWCMAAGVSDISVYDSRGNARRRAACGPETRAVVGWLGGLVAGWWAGGWWGGGGLASRSPLALNQRPGRQLCVESPVCVVN